MTEASSQSYTPYLLYLSAETESKEVVQQKIQSTFPSNNNLEVLWINEENSSISIDNVRELTQSLSFAAYQGTIRHVILLSLEKASHQAQNALLKLLEEPPANTQFWLTTTSSTAVLPTIISRCQEVVIVTSGVQQQSEEISILEKLEQLSHRELSELAEKYSDREAAQELLVQMIQKAHSQLATQTKRYAMVLQVLLQTKLYVDANVNVRLALEHGLFTIKRLAKTQE